MLLVELTVNSVKKYISNEWLEIEHFYEGYVASLNGLRIATPSIHAVPCTSTGSAVVVESRLAEKPNNHPICK